MTLKVKWADLGREPQCAPDPAYPDGMYVDLRIDKDAPSCEADLEYPARRCGLFLVKCNKCGNTAAITTAGRPDDPRHVTMQCRFRT